MPKILVAEDDQLISGSLVSALKEHGFEVEAAMDGELAVAKAKEIMPDLMLLDVMMPKLDGIGVLWELKANEATSKIPVIVLTNMADMNTISKILEAGGSDYLLKSDQSMDTIVAKVKEVLARVVQR
jgi:adenylate cyclase